MGWPVNWALDRLLVEGLPEQLLRLEPRLPESLRHQIHFDPPLGLRPVRELDDGPFAPPLPHADRNRDDARDDGDRTAHVQEEWDVVQEDDEEQAEEEGEANQRVVRERVENQQARRT